MAQNVIVTLTAAGLGTGPYNLYAVDANSNAALLVSNVPKNLLLVGYSLSVSNVYSAIRIESANATCNNYVDIAIPATAFISTWRTTTAFETVTLPLISPYDGGNYSFSVDWGDGSPINNITNWNQPQVTHTYNTPGDHTVTIVGTIEGIGWSNGGPGNSPDSAKLISVQQWGQLKLGNGGYYFAQCSNLDLATVVDGLDLTGTTDLLRMFADCTSLTTIANADLWDTSAVTGMNSIFNGASNFSTGNITGWNTALVTDMSYAFRNATAFNLDISSWTTSNVTDMTSMFEGASTFDQNISTWDVSNVQYMGSMFQDATAFNEPIGNWERVGSTVANVVDMTAMFSSATNFDQDINNWNTGNVVDMAYMFYNAGTFNQDLDNWDMSNVTRISSMFMNATGFNGKVGTWTTSNVTQMTYLFAGAQSFNQSVGGWDITGVTSLESVFLGASSFNSPLNGWNVSHVTNMRYLFNGASSFDKALSSWDTSNVTTMANMFEFAFAFNKSLNNWNVSNVVDMSYMFRSATSYDQPMSNWNVYNVSLMTGMFQNATAFNQALGNWTIANVISLTNFMAGKSYPTFSSANYNNILTGWYANGTRYNLTANFGGLKYTIAGGGAARTNLINNNGWTITDGGSV